MWTVEKNTTYDIKGIDFDTIELICLGLDSLKESDSLIDGKKVQHIIDTFEAIL